MVPAYWYMFIISPIDGLHANTRLTDRPRDTWEHVAEVAIPKAGNDLIDLAKPEATPTKPFAYFEEDAPALVNEALIKPTPTPPPASLPPKPRYAVVTSVWDSNYASLALMLGWSIKKHNPLEDLGIDLVLLTLTNDKDGAAGITVENATRLEKVGWKIRVEERMELPGVNMNLIQPHRRLNLNKLKIFGWEEYEKVVFMDADMICKGSIADLFTMPGGKSSLLPTTSEPTNRCIPPQTSQPHPTHGTT
jgi:hypothetical protein